MSSLLETIASRRSSYPDQFIDKEITREVLDQLLKSASYAPSHRKTYPWRFVVFNGASKTELGNFLAATYQKITPQEKYSSFKHKKVGDKVKKSGSVIAICMQRDPNESVPEWEEVAATAMAVQNIWLQLEGLDLGGYWSSPSLKDYLKDFVTLEEGQKCLGFFYLGYINKGISDNKDLLDLAEFVTYA